jgi:hypothetical protein
MFSQLAGVQTLTTRGAGHAEKLIAFSTAGRLDLSEASGLRLDSYDSAKATRAAGTRLVG